MSYIVYDRVILLVQWSEKEADLTQIITFVENSAEIKMLTASLRSHFQLPAS